MINSQGFHLFNYNRSQAKKRTGYTGLHYNIIRIDFFFSFADSLRLCVFAW